MELKAKVIFADSRRLSELLPQSSVDLVLAGPPYWNDVVYSNDKEQLSKFEDYESFLREISKVWESSSKVLKNGSILAIWVHDLIRKMDNGYKYIPLHSDILKTIPSDLILRNMYIWDRYLNKDKGKIENNSFGSRIQYILIFQKNGVGKNQDKIERSLTRLFWQPVWYKKTTPKFMGSSLVFRILFSLSKLTFGYGQRITNWLSRYKILKDKYKFKSYITECPEDVSDLLIKLFSSMGDTVLDPFAGSGTTLKSALKQNRNAIGIEINKGCREVIKMKLNGRVTFDL